MNLCAKCGKSFGGTARKVCPTCRKRAKSSYYRAWRRERDEAERLEREAERAAGVGVAAHRTSLTAARERAVTAEQDRRQEQAAAERRCCPQCWGNLVPDDRPGDRGVEYLRCLACGHLAMRPTEPRQVRAQATPPRPQPPSPPVEPDTPEKTCAGPAHRPLSSWEREGH